MSRRREETGQLPMDDRACTAFLQWALPRRQLRWAGFRKVRGQVCKRLQRRINELGLRDVNGYRAQLEADPAEWRVFDACCRVTISRFFRDRGVFEVLRNQVLPAIAERAGHEQRTARTWSAGCASGEEPYTLRILWDLEIAPRAELSIVATDIDDAVLARARVGEFAASSLRELPPGLVAQAFERDGSRFSVRPQYRAIEFLRQDLRFEAPPGPFDLILCRYLAFTYFEVPLQREVLARLTDRLAPGGYLVIGTHEPLPAEGSLEPLGGAPQIFCKRAASG